MHHFQYALSSNSEKLKLFDHRTFESMLDCWYAVQQEGFVFSVSALYVCMAGGEVLPKPCVLR